MSDVTQEPKEVPNNFHTEQEWQKKFFAMGACCHYCKKPLLLSEATKDHRTPKCRGGSNRIWNIVPACLPCNQKKGWRTEAEFLKAYPVFSTYAQPRPAKDKPKAQNTLAQEQEPTTHFDLIDQPHLKKLRQESEGLSWAWRNPA